MFRSGSLESIIMSSKTEGARMIGSIGEDEDLIDDDDWQDQD